MSEHVCYPSFASIGRGLLRRGHPADDALRKLAVMEKRGWVYIITNTHHTTLYVGASSNLKSRIIQHREKKFARSFSATYNLYKLVYYETFDTVNEAFERERQLKAGSRKRKEKLINGFNPEWKDLFDQLAS